MVCWVGASLPQEVERECANRGLQVEAIGPDEVRTACLRGARAALVANVPEARQLLVSIYQIAAACGTALAIALTDDYPDAASANAASVIKRSRTSPVPVVDARDGRAYSAAEYCASHMPGPIPNLALEISPSVEDEAQRLLFQRAFYDFRSIRLKELHGGYTQARLWRVDAGHGPDERAHPFVAKLDRDDAITDQIQTMQEFVADQLPYVNYAPTDLHRCVAGAGVRLMVSKFVGAATQFDTFMGLHPTHLAITALFDGALRNWRECTTEERIQLGRVYRDGGILPEPATLAQACAASRARRRRPESVIERILRRPAQTVRICRGHGDLQIRNVFVRESTADVVLIDFPGPIPTTHALRDPASLDVSLGFYEASGGAVSAEDESILRRLYEPPLLGCRRRPEDTARAVAVLRVRMYARMDALTWSEYDLAVACHLLRFASFTREPMDRRALAYELACELA